MGLSLRAAKVVAKGPLQGTVVYGKGGERDHRGLMVRSILRNSGPSCTAIKKGAHAGFLGAPCVSTFFNRGAGRSRIPQSIPNNEPPLITLAPLASVMWRIY